MTYIVSGGALNSTHSLTQQILYAISLFFKSTNSKFIRTDHLDNNSGGRAGVSFCVHLKLMPKFCFPEPI